MTNSPFLLDLPAVVSFSGGRTSGYMLRQILDAHQEQPEGLAVCFQNTGLEHVATYEFIKEVSERWTVDITWLEYCLSEDGNHDFKVVDYETASRKGEPFSHLIRKKRYLPNPVARICTSNLKVRTLDRHLKGLPGFADGYTNAIGLRWDEPKRANRMRNDNARESTICPLYEAKQTEDDVLAFWRENDFDLELPLSGNIAGNCVGCFLKGRSKIELLMKEMPEYFDWWVDMEATARTDKTLTSATAAVFRSDRPNYAAMMEQTKRQGWLPYEGGADDVTLPCMCHD